MAEPSVIRCVVLAVVSVQAALGVSVLGMQAAAVVVALVTESVVVPAKEPSEVP